MAGPEPESLEDLVNFDRYGFLADMSDVPPENVETELNLMRENPAFDESFTRMMDDLSPKYVFDIVNARISKVHLDMVDFAYEGSVLSWWSEEGPSGTRALIVGALMLDLATGENSSLVFGVPTNLLSPEHYPETDPYIIVNAMPYIFLEWKWLPPIDLPTGVISPYGIIHWKYWWYDSHSHPNWFWSCYWWWRVYYHRYYKGYWLPWYWWFWHWIYWRHWYWWSTYFPYSYYPAATGP